MKRSKREGTENSDDSIPKKHKHTKRPLFNASVQLLLPRIAIFFDRRHFHIYPTSKSMQNFIIRAQVQLFFNSNISSQMML